MSERGKLSAYCIVCAEQHSHSWMRKYIEICQGRGKDPLDSKSGGIMCPVCLLRTIQEWGDEADDADATKEPA